MKSSNGGFMSRLLAAALALGGRGTAAVGVNDLLSSTFTSGARGRKTRLRMPNNEPYTDSAGISHGRPGDKLARKAAQGRVGVCHRPGPYNGLTIGRKTGKRANA